MDAHSGTSSLLAHVLHEEGERHKGSKLRDSSELFAFLCDSMEAGGVACREVLQTLRGHEQTHDERAHQLANREMEQKAEDGEYVPRAEKEKSRGAAASREQQSQRARTASMAAKWGLSFDSSAASSDERRSA